MISSHGSRTLTTAHVRPARSRDEPGAADPQAMRLQPGAYRRSQGLPAADHAGVSGRRFRGRVRSRALCAVQRPDRPRLPRPPARSAGHRDAAAQHAQRSRRHTGRPAADGAGSGARHRLARPAAGARLRRALGSAGRSQAAPLRLVRRVDAEAAAGDRGRRRSGHRGGRDGVSRSRSPICGAPMPPITGGGSRKAHALDVAKEVLGPRWARDHELDKKPVLAEALETAFDPEASAASIHLEAVRDQAAAWLPPGFACAEAAAEVEPADGNRGRGTRRRCGGRSGAGR